MYFLSMDARLIYFTLRISKIKVIKNSTFSEMKKREILKLPLYIKTYNDKNRYTPQ